MPAAGLAAQPACWPGWPDRPPSRPHPREASVVLVVVAEHTTTVTLSHRTLRPIPLETAASATDKSVRMPVLGGRHLIAIRRCHGLLLGCWPHLLLSGVSRRRLRLLHHCRRLLAVLLGHRVRLVVVVAPASIAAGSPMTSSTPSCLLCLSF